MPSRPSVFSRFRMAGAGVIVAIGVLAAGFYAVVTHHFLGAITSRTLGPYSDTLAEHGFASRDPEVWRRMAEQHHVGILVEPPEGEPLVFDGRGRPTVPEAIRTGELLAVRTAPDGTRVTLAWNLLAFKHGHFPLLGGLFVMVGLVVGSAFWFLDRQLKPLAGLRAGVDRVGRGDFATPVPIVRNDEIGQVAASFNAMAGRVGEMIDDRERLLADVSHELRSPIARMRVALEFVPPGDKRDALDRDLREMEHLIAVLLEREALRSRTGRPNVREMRLDKIAAEVVREFQNRVPGVELVASGSPTLSADPALIKLLIRNLVDNAVKFSRPESRPVVVTLSGGEEQVELRVADDGIGIPAGSESRLFEPFVKADPARGHGVGYGVGLDLCRRIVELHGGTIRLVSREPRGAEAIVCFGHNGSSHR